MKLAQLRQTRKTKADELLAMSALEGDAFKQDAYDALKTEIGVLDASITRQAEALTLAGNNAEPADGNPADNPSPIVRAAALPMQRAFSGVQDRSIMRSFDQWNQVTRDVQGFGFSADKHFRSFGEQLQAVAASSSQNRAAGPDARLVRAPTGAGEVDATGGGFLVQTDFADTIFTLAHDMGQILSRVTRLPISSNANGIKIPAVDETSRATGSRWGGVSSYWVDEGTTANPSKPKFRVIELNLKKLMSTMYITDELLQDTTALTTIAGLAFAEEIAFMTEDAVWEGTGAGQPMGIINSPALVTVAATGGQTAKTVTMDNILAMWSRLWARSRANAVWFINQDVEPTLYSMTQGIGLAGFPAYMPPGGLSQAPYGTLIGRPVIATEYSSTVGTVGDIVLADMSQYILADKGGVNAASSMHVAFLSDQMVFRITYRVDGKPIWTKPLTPFKGTATKSPFIALAAR